VREGNVVVVSAGSSMEHSAMVREIRGSLWRSVDPRFLVIALLSLLIHAGLAWYLHTRRIEETGQVEIEKMPERFARLIVDKPIPKQSPAVPAKETSAAEKTEQPEAAEETAPEKAEAPEVRRAHAKKSVAARTKRVEEKVRTVGVLGMLGGKGPTAKGPAIVDVLGSSRDGKERLQDLEKALENMEGLKQAKDLEVTEKKLVKSKEVSVDHKESIDDLLAAVTAPLTRELEKQGDFVVQRPESIEGAAASSTKRDDAAINRVVAAKKASIKRMYLKHLKRDPGLQGKITVRYTISARGTVIKVDVLENTTGSTALAGDIVRQMRFWRFEAIPEGEVTVTYPFLFVPS
jgi:TonB family protein